jgi:hypothetical protein
LRAGKNRVLSVVPTIMPIGGRRYQERSLDDELSKIVTDYLENPVFRSSV